VQEELKIGQYILVAKIGEGGMAEVWEAHHVFLDNRVAVKFLLPEYARNRELQERFLNEAKRQAQLQHQNIVPALDFFQVDGRSYLVMQYVEGQSLDERLKKPNPPLSIDEIHSISWDVLSALDHAHLQGVIHRDVKPANVLLDRSGRALLMDFGIAKALREERSMTMTGTSMGTPDYMSPEQIREPRKVDARSDVYSFGCVLYAMLSGDPPFGTEATSPFVVQDRQVRDTPPALVYSNSKVPPVVGDVVFRCLEKDPAKRFQSCGAVMIALDAAISPARFPDHDKDGSFPGASNTSHEISGRETAKRPHPVTHIDTGGGSKGPDAVGQTRIESQPQNPNATKSPTDIRTPAGIKKYVMAGVAAAVLISALAYFLTRPKSSTAAQPQAPPNYSHARYDDPALSNCKGDNDCQERKAQADKLAGVQDWNKLPYNSPILRDCMAYEPCMARKAHAEQLLAVTDWRHADKQLLSDCMSYQPCVKENRPPVVISGDEGGLPSCCKDAGNPAACRATKKKEQLPDCASPLDSN
jgi:serine/threonine protein kinase